MPSSPPPAFSSYNSISPRSITTARNGNLVSSPSVKMTDDESNDQNRRRASTPRSSTPRKPTVCTNCRQSKVSHDAVESSSLLPLTDDSSRLQVRCIGSENDSCDRCRRLQAECNRDPGFKRVSKMRYVVLRGSLHWLIGLIARSPNLKSKSNFWPRQ